MFEKQIKAQERYFEIWCNTWMERNDTWNIYKKSWFKNYLSKTNFPLHKFLFLLHIYVFMRHNIECFTETLHAIYNLVI